MTPITIVSFKVTKTGLDFIIAKYSRTGKRSIVERGCMDNIIALNDYAGSVKSDCFLGYTGSGNARTQSRIRREILTVLATGGGFFEVKRIRQLKSKTRRYNPCLTLPDPKDEYQTHKVIVPDGFFTKNGNDSDLLDPCDAFVWACKANPAPADTNGN